MDNSDLKNLLIKMQAIEKTVNIEKLQARLDSLMKELEDENLYKDFEKSKRINAEVKKLDERIKNFRQLRDNFYSINELYELSQDDSAMLEEISKEIVVITPKIEKLYLSTLLRGEYDNNNAILTIHSGAGGTEAQDWAKMLYRMYKMFCEKAGYAIEEIDYFQGDEAGIKRVTFIAKGLNAYGFLRAESGVHRLVRISPFDSNARRHTSFASLEVMPEIENNTSIIIKPDDLKIDTYRSGGAGGQHVNKTESAIRITHLPTGIVVQCQNERSQLQNKEIAMKLLIGKLAEKQERENLEKTQNLKGELKKIEWGSQIRSYVFHPYNMVKDHRTNFSTSDIDSVMNGDLDDFIKQYLIMSVSND